MENRFDNPTPALRFELTVDMLDMLHKAMLLCKKLGRSSSVAVFESMASPDIKDPNKFGEELTEFLLTLKHNVKTQGYTAKIVLE